MRAFLQKHLSDILILVGCGLVIYATWLLSWIAAIYTGGGILIVLGVLVGIGEAKGGAQRAHAMRPHEDPAERGDE